MFDLLDVARRDLCIGCGACSVATEGRTPIYMDSRGLWQADLTDLPSDDYQAANAVCPFSDASPSETEVARELGFDIGQRWDDRIGYSKSIWAGRRADDPAALEKTSSGGITSWILEQLLASDLIDAVVHVGDSQSSTAPVVTTRVTSDASEILKSAKSRYISTTLDEALRRVRGDGRRYAVVGVPCYITALRHLCGRDPVLRQQLPFLLGLVCGHMKSTFFATSLAWQAGIAPGELGDVDFRVKTYGSAASDYALACTSKDGHSVQVPMRSLLGSNWGHALFQPEACNFCDDIFAETADVTMGDAWLGEYAHDWRGTNVVISRNAEIDDLLREGVERGDLDLSPLTAERAAASQAGNFRHRRDGLSIRLADDAAESLPVPRKRVSADNSGFDDRRLNIVRLRRSLSRRSFVYFSEALRMADLDHFINRMGVAIDEYDVATRGAFRERLRGRFAIASSPIRTAVRRLRNNRSHRRRQAP